VEVVVERSPSFPGCEKMGLGVGGEVGTAIGIRVVDALGYAAHLATANRRTESSQLGILMNHLDTGGKE
jgi:hypothetical protein